MTDDELLEASIGDTIGTKTGGVLGKVRDAGISALGKTLGIRTPRAGNRLSVRVLADELTNRWLGYLANHKAGGQPLEGNVDDLRHFVQRYFGQDTLNAVEPVITKVTGSPPTGNAGGGNGGTPNGPQPGPTGPNVGPAGTASNPNVLPFPPGARTRNPRTPTAGAGPGVGTSYQHSYQGAAPPQGSASAPVAASQQPAPTPTPNGNAAPLAAGNPNQPPPGSTLDQVRDFHTQRKAALDGELKNVGREFAKEYQRSNGKESPALQQLEKKQENLRAQIEQHDEAIRNPQPAPAAPASTQEPSNVEHNAQPPAQASGSFPQGVAMTPQGVAPSATPAASNVPSAAPKPKRNTDDGLTIPPVPGSPEQIPDFLKNQKNKTRPAPVVPDMTNQKKRPGQRYQSDEVVPGANEPAPIHPVQKAAWNKRKADLMQKHDDLLAKANAPVRRFGQKGTQPGPYGDPQQGTYDEPSEVNKPAFGKKGTGAPPPAFEPGYRPASQTHNSLFRSASNLFGKRKPTGKQEPSVGDSTEVKGRQEPSPPTPEAPSHEQDQVVSKITDALSNAQTDDGRAKIKDKIRQMQANPAMMAKYPALKKINATESFSYRGELLEVALYRSQIDPIFKAVASHEMLNGNAFVGKGQPEHRMQTFGGQSKQQGGMPYQQQQTGPQQQQHGHSGPVAQQIVTSRQIANAYANVANLVNRNDFQLISQYVQSNGGGVPLQNLVYEPSLQHIDPKTWAALMFAIGRSP